MALSQRTESGSDEAVPMAAKKKRSVRADFMEREFQSRSWLSCGFHQAVGTPERSDNISDRELLKILPPGCASGPRSFTGRTSEMSRTNRIFRWTATKLCAQCLCLMIGCFMFDRADACLLPSDQTGIIFEHIPAGIDAPVIAEVTIFGREANVIFPNGAKLAVMNARIEKVIKGSLDGGVLKIVTYLHSCSRIGGGHGFVAGRLQRDAQRGLELVAIQLPFGR